MSEACYNASQPVKTNPGVVLDVSVVSGGSSDVNLIELAGNPIDVNIGNASAGTQRVVLASDQPPIPVSVTFPSTADINLIQLAGTPVSVNAGTADNGTLRVVVATDQSALPVSQFGTWNLNNITGTISLPTGAATETTLVAIKAQTDQLTFSATRLLVDASGTVQPISGTVTVLQGTSPWVISGSVTANAGTNLNTSLLALDSTLTNATQKSQIVDGSGNVWGPRTGSGGVNWFPVINLEAASDGSAVASRTLQIGGSDGTNLRNISVDTTGKLNINNISGIISLPTGASTSALQTSGNISLSSIDSKLNTLGQKTMATSAPVVIASDQSAIPVSVTFPATVAVTQSTVPWVVSGAVTANAGTNLNTSLLLLDSTFTARINTLGQKISANSTPVVIASDQSTLPVSVSNFPATVAVTQSTSPWVVSGTVAATQSGTWNINNISGTISLPTGAATSALQTTGNTSLSSIDGKLNSLGQKTMAGSVPVVIASDQTAIPISGTITATPGTSSTSSVTRVATANTSHQLIAANASRKGLVFYNDSTSQQFIKFGTTATQTDFTVRLSTQDYYEVPQPVYAGRIDVLGTNSNGAIQVTELT